MERQLFAVVSCRSIASVISTVAFEELLLSVIGTFNLKETIQFVLLVTNLFRKAPSTPSSEASILLEWISSEAQ